MDMDEFYALPAESHQEVTVPNNFAVGAYPYYDIAQRESSFSVAAAVPTLSANGNRHLVIIAYRETDGAPDVSIWCGDRFSEKEKLDAAEARERMKEACKGLPDKKMRTEATSQMENSFREQFAQSHGCNFWTTWRADRKLCKHAKAVLAAMRGDSPDGVDIVTQLSTLYTQFTKTAKAGAPVGFTLQSLAFKVPVLVEGDRGSGKTVEARELARTLQCQFVEMPGHNGVEAIDVLGHLVPSGFQQMVWKDGAVSQAFRIAKKEKVVLLLDELLRIPQRELSVLLTALSPDRGVYRLRTGRLTSVEDGIGVEEVLECPVENLCVVATTNVGSDFAVDECDPALAERFVVIRKDTTAAGLRAILDAVALKCGFSIGVVGKLVDFFVKMSAARAQGVMRHAPTTRTLARALELAATESDIPDALRALTLLWVARDQEGRPVAEQVATVEKLINDQFK